MKCIIERVWLSLNAFASVGKSVDRFSGEMSGGLVCNVYLLRDNRCASSISISTLRRTNYQAGGTSISLSRSIHLKGQVDDETGAPFPRGARGRTADNDSLRNVHKFRNRTPDSRETIRCFAPWRSHCARIYIYIHIDITLCRCEKKRKWERKKEKESGEIALSRNLLGGFSGRPVKGVFELSEKIVAPNRWNFNKLFLSYL